MRLWGVLPTSKLVSPDLTGLTALRPDERASTEATLALAVDGNPWVDAMRALGHRVETSGARIPVDEGETSLNASFHQAISSLLPCSGESPGAVVLGSMAFGNHSLAHSLAGFALGFADPPSALRELKTAFAGLGPDEHLDRCLARPSMAKVRGDLAKRAALRQERLFRFPASLFGAPEPDALRRLAAGLGLGPTVTRTLLSAREATRSAGLTGFADFALVCRAALIRELARLIEIDASGHVPLSLEHLVTTTTGRLTEAPLSSWVADCHVALRNQLEHEDERRCDGRAEESTPSVPKRGVQEYRVLNYFVSERLVEESAKSIAGRHSEYGWNTLKAAFSTGAIGADPAGLARRPVAELLAAGFGLSGKLVYHAASRINGGRVCNLVHRSKPHVFSALADPARPNRVIALGRAHLRGGPRMEYRALNLYLGMDRVCESHDPRGLAKAMFREFAALVADPNAEEVPLVLLPPAVARREQRSLVAWQNGAARVVV